MLQVRGPAVLYPLADSPVSGDAGISTIPLETPDRERVELQPIRHVWRRLTSPNGKVTLRVKVPVFGNPVTLVMPPRARRFGRRP